VQDLFAIPIDDGFHLLGADGMTLGGDSAEWVVKELAQLLDGTRTLAELHALLSDISAASLTDVLHLMHMHGMLEEGADTASAPWRAAVDDRFRSQGEFFSRYLRITGHCRNRYDAQRALAAASVSLVGKHTWMPMLAQQLASNGVGTIHCHGQPPFGGSKAGLIEWSSGDTTAPGAVDLLVCLGDASEQERVARQYIDQRCVLLFVDVDSLRLGPLTYPRESACPICAQAQLDPPVAGPDVDHDAAHTLWSIALLSRATQQIVGYLTGLFQPAALGAVEVWSPSIGNSALHEVLWLPGCPLCGDVISPLTVETPQGAKDNMALMYHRNAAIRPWNIRQPAGMQHHLSTDVGRLSRSAYLSHSWAERVRLPRAALPRHGTEDATEQQAEPTPTGHVDLEVLSPLLYYSVGGTSTPTVDGGHHLTRHTASGGNLGSAEVYLAVSNVHDLADGVYHYLMVDHALELLRSGRFVEEIADCWLEASERLSSTPECASTVLLVIVSAVQRLRAKYAERGYSYCLLDAGLVAHRLDTLAVRLSVQTRATWKFDDERLSDILGTDGIGLAPTLMVALEREV
jgi:SagB-type dehydrogenase family enzyme